jgi:hypothetical protein
MKYRGQRKNVDGFYRETLQILDRARIRFLIGGAYALKHYTGICRDTKDIDCFIRKQDLERVLAEYSKHGYRTAVLAPHWLGKVYHPNKKDFCDVIFGSGNGLCSVDEEWFAYAVAGELLEVPVRFSPPEEMIWQKAFIMERERYDGADVAHLIKSQHQTLDWHRLLRRFHGHSRVLLSHLILFGYIYPGERYLVPDWVQRELLRSIEQENGAASLDKAQCQGTLLSRSQYSIDVEEWGYQDARLAATPITPEQASDWSAAAAEEEPEKPPPNS